MQPIILAHGFIGYRNFLFWSMFGGVVEALQQHGCQAIQTITHPTATIEQRSRRLVEYINRELGEETRFHWVGHSMGGLDGRYIASPKGMNLGHRFLSLTTLSTPHRGSSIAAKIPRWATWLLSHAAGIGRHLMSGEQRQFLEGLAECNWQGLKQLTPQYIEQEFNPRITDHPDVKYVSYAGLVDYSNIRLSNLPRQPVWRFMKTSEGDNDCMVSVESAKWGEFKGILPCDHGAMVGLHFIPWAKHDFDYIAFFVALAQELGRFEDDIIL